MLGFVQIRNAALVAKARDVLDRRVLARVQVVAHAVLHRLDLELLVVIAADLCGQGARGRCLKAWDVCLWGAA